VPGLGFVDTGLAYHQSVYTSLGRGAADQLSAMPSVHVGWAVAIGLAVVLISSSRWRWLVLLHPIATVLVVVVTGNHFWLDGIVASVILVVAYLAVSTIHGRAGARRSITAGAERPCSAVKSGVTG
jgi:hypothetical protein